MRRPLFLILSSFMAVTTMHAQATIQTPEPGSTERKAILAAAHAGAQKALGKPVEFVVKLLRQQGDWAFLRATMQEPDGQPLSYVGTPFEAADARGQKSANYDALLRREADHWTVRDQAVGPTDVEWALWQEAHDAPAALFTPSENP